MCLPSDEAELRRWAEFAVTRWALEHHVLFICLHAICLGMPMTRADFLKIVRAYVDCRTENRRPLPGAVNWR